jgi:hypothetical protein
MPSPFAFFSITFSSGIYVVVSPDELLTLAERFKWAELPMRAERWEVPEWLMVAKRFKVSEWLKLTAPSVDEVFNLVVGMGL